MALPWGSEQDLFLVCGDRQGYDLCHQAWWSGWRLAPRSREDPGTSVQYGVL